MPFIDDEDGNIHWFFLPVNGELLPDKARWFVHHWVPWLVEATLRGLSQVVIVNNPLSGLCILIALLVSPGNGLWM